MPADEIIDEADGIEVVEVVLDVGDVAEEMDDDILGLYWVRSGCAASRRTSLYRKLLPTVRIAQSDRRVC
jgi:hypothetical protein